ncbi:Chloride intracellular channel protein 6 [Platysternon megacephalum]|uniref:Chloride intracellular channel protein 6 n=1 Tax=Platysternon megacephalum TaxID=55544 RepID=A0A4D9EIC2_9SAUR|nr:Chloride intracellular channel protein 6 [Platysternon megacephalum]
MVAGVKQFMLRFILSSFSFRVNFPCGRTPGTAHTAQNHGFGLAADSDGPSGHMQKDVFIIIWDTNCPPCYLKKRAAGAPTEKRQYRGPPATVSIDQYDL